MNHRRAGAGPTRTLAALLALLLPLSAASLLIQPASATAAETSPGGGAAGAPGSASAAKAFALARDTGQRVEIIDQRTEYSETYANPNGNLTHKQFTLPVWTRHDSVWRRTDATITEHEDGTIGPTAAFGISFSTGGQGALVAMERDGKKLALTWPGKLPEPVVGGNTALYKEVLPGVDLKLIAEVNGFAEHLIVTTPEAAANPALKSIKLAVTTDGVTLDDDAGDRLLAKDAGGNIIFSAPRPKMWEQPPPAPESSNGAAPGAQSAPALGAAAAADTAEPAAARQAPVGADVEANLLTLTPDPALLAGATQFPLVIDPIFTGGYTEKWAVVYSATPGADYPWGSGWTSSNPADEPRVGNNGSGDTQSFFAMNTNGLRGATILNATFAVEQTYSWGCDASAAGPTELWSAKDIGATPTWSTRNNYWGHYLAEGNFAHGNTTHCPGVEGFDFHSSELTAYVQEGASKGWDPLVFGLRVPNSYLGNPNSFKRLRNNPVLSVDYNFQPEVIGNGAFEGSWAPAGDGNKPVPCGGLIGNSGLALTATLRDNDGGPVVPDFVVTTAAGAPVPVSNVTTVFSGGTATATVLAQNLPTGNYKWKVRARDGEGPDGPFTGECNFTVDKTGPTSRVAVTKEDGSALTVQQARTKMRVKLKNPATDLAGFCWAIDRPISVSGSPCSSNTWVPLAAGATEAVIEVVPTGRPQSTLYVIAYDKAGNHSSTDGAADTTVLKTSPAAFVYPTGQTPLSKRATKDLLGDLNGDGYTDMLATESDNKLRLYTGDGTGKVKAQTIGYSGWGDALLAHGGDFTNLNGPTAAPDGYEDTLARLNNNHLYLYPGNGLGNVWYATRQELAPPSDLGSKGWGRVLQIITPGDMDQRADAGFAQGNDLLTLECVDDACTSARLRLYSGQTVSDGSADQTEPFHLQSDTNIIGPTGAWKDHTILAVGDQNGDGVKDVLTRYKTDGNLYLYPGQLTNGTYSLGSRTVYGTGGWAPNSRPLITTGGNAQGTVVSKNVNDSGTLIPFSEFQPKAGDAQGDLWATTPADPNNTVGYDDGTGSPTSTTCPTGCLLFYPGGTNTHRAPLLVGQGGWATTITGIF
ncbi:FG-GAP repeat domain-containing protein [Streptomyces sp. NPDC060028]|uniref:FG-GAP repeat domain-containing protein n=1 Tax=Streptomyces sp. NPDC060028 TaxID=3347041 RepID=UPI00368A9CB0